MKNLKKIVITVSLILVINAGLFARTTYVHSSYDNRVSYLFNDIYSSVMFNTSVFTPLYESESEPEFKMGINFNGSTFFKDFPVGAYYSVDIVPFSSNEYSFDFIVGLATRFQTSPLTETYFNFGPAISVIGELEETSLLTDPYSLIYWGGAINGGYRFFPSTQSKYITVDVGATIKGLWYDPSSSENTLSYSVNDFRVVGSAYIGLTFRWFAPDLDEDDVNIIVHL